MERKILKIQNIIYIAGDMIRDSLNNPLELQEKETYDWVTNIDMEIEKFLVDSVTALYPNSSFLTEEDTVNFNKGDEVWIIDPIDGTSNMIYQKEHFAISVAYYLKGSPIFGIVYDVMKDEMYIGVSNHGSYLNGTRIENLDSRLSLDSGMILGDIFGPGMFSLDLAAILNNVAGFRHFGSGAIDICRLAIGKASAYAFPTIKIWDIAAAIIILKEVGGTWMCNNIQESVPLTTTPIRFLAAPNEDVLNELKSWL